MKQKSNTEQSPDARRKTIAADLKAYLEAGNKIDYIANGVSSQDPLGRGQPLRLGNPKK